MISCNLGSMVSETSLSAKINEIPEFDVTVGGRIADANIEIEKENVDDETEVRSADSSTADKQAVNDQDLVTGGAAAKNRNMITLNIRLLGDYIPAPKNKTNITNQPEEGNPLTLNFNEEEVSRDDLNDGPRKPSFGFGGISALQSSGSGAQGGMSRGSLVEMYAMTAT